MTELIQMKGEKFGRWTVLMRDTKAKYSSWICKCDCGVIKSVLCRIEKKNCPKPNCIWLEK